MRDTGVLQGNGAKLKSDSVTTATRESVNQIIHLENGQSYNDELKKAVSFLNGRLLNYKRVHGIVVYEEDFPRTASMKIKRNVLAESLAKLDRATVVKSL